MFTTHISVFHVNIYMNINKRSSASCLPWNPFHARGPVRFQSAATVVDLVACICKDSPPDHVHYHKNISNDLIICCLYVILTSIYYGHLCTWQSSCAESLRGLTCPWLEQIHPFPIKYESIQTRLHEKKSQNDVIDLNQYLLCHRHNASKCDTHVHACGKISAPLIPTRYCL